MRPSKLELRIIKAYEDLAREDTELKRLTIERLLNKLSKVR